MDWTDNMVVIISFIAFIIQVPMDIWTLRAFLGTNIVETLKMRTQEKSLTVFSTPEQQKILADGLVLCSVRRFPEHYAKGH